MTVIVPRSVFLYVMMEIRPEHTVMDAHNIVGQILSDYGLDNICPSAIIDTLNELIALDDMTVRQKRLFLH